MNALARLTYGRPLEEREAAARIAPRPGTLLIGRVLLATIFVISGLGKLMQWDQTVAYMTAQGLPWAAGLLVIAAAAEILGGLSIATGTFARLGALGLVVYLVITTVVFHDFWNLAGAERQAQLIHFLKNLAILGGLLALVAHGAGRYAVDRTVEKKIG